MSSINRLLASAAIAAVALGAATAASAQTKIRVGYSVIPVHLAPLIWNGSGTPKHVGKSYTTELIHFRGSAPQLTALAAGELEIEGDVAVVEQLFEMLDDFSLMFDVVAPDAS